MMEMTVTGGNNLRGIVLSKYSSISGFARALNWDRKKASRIVNMKQKPNAQEMEQMAECLDVHDVYSFVHIFLPTLDTKWHPDEPEVDIPMPAFMR